MGSVQIDPFQLVKTPGRQLRPDNQEFIPQHQVPTWPDCIAVGKNGSELLGIWLFTRLGKEIYRLMLLASNKEKFSARVLLHRYKAPPDHRMSDISIRNMFDGTSEDTTIFWDRIDSHMFNLVNDPALRDCREWFSNLPGYLLERKLSYAERQDPTA